MFGMLFQGSHLVVLPLVALPLFIAVFAGAVVRVYRQKAAAYAEVARLPLDEGGRTDA